MAGNSKDLLSHSASVAGTEELRQPGESEAGVIRDECRRGHSRRDGQQGAAEFPNLGEGSGCK
jgi:hypothetical protein